MQHPLNKPYEKHLRTWKYTDEEISPAAYRILKDIIRHYRGLTKLDRELYHYLMKIACTAQIWPLNENSPKELVVEARLKGLPIAVSK